MTKACQVVHIFSCVIHLDVVVRAAVCICIFGTDNFTFLDADGIACRVETAKCYIVIIVLCEVNLQFSTKSLTSECPQFVPPVNTQTKKYFDGLRRQPSICRPRNPATVCASLNSRSVAAGEPGCERNITQPSTSPSARIGAATAMA